MNHPKGRTVAFLLIAISFSSLMFSPSLHAQNKVLGEVELVGGSKVENTSGVWIDGQYVGYLHELKGSKKLLLLPGEHNITVKQGGYLDFAQNVSVRAGEKQTIDVKMEKDTRVTMPTTTAEDQAGSKAKSRGGVCGWRLRRSHRRIRRSGQGPLGRAGKAQNQNQSAWVSHL